MRKISAWKVRVCSKYGGGKFDVLAPNYKCAAQMAIAAARKEYGDRKARIEPLDIEFQAEYDKDGKA